MTRPDIKSWKRTPRGKLICPECGQTGWPYAEGMPGWLDKHGEHADCSDCGKTVAVRGMSAHRRVHDR
jgi:predicted RNA-binding Zn-ribbon protein involved in translation (DUF1610 family)